LGCGAGDAVYDAVLGREGRSEGGERGVIDGYVGDVRVWGRVVYGFGTRDSGDVETGWVFFENVSDNR
jgi:hypothetical protein